MLLVGMGGTFGAVSRFLIGQWIISKSKGKFPWGTWIINISGSFILGLFAVLYWNKQIPQSLWFFFGTGFLGSYTTFSTFGYETMQMVQRKDIRAAIFYVFLSVLLGVVFAWLGSLFAANI